MKNVAIVCSTLATCACAMVAPGGVIVLAFVLHAGVLAWSVPRRHKHRWMVRGTVFDWSAPMHVRYCCACGVEQMVMFPAFDLAPEEQRT